MKIGNVAEIGLKVLSIYLVMGFLAFLPVAVGLIKMDNQMRQTHGEEPSFARSVIAPGVLAVEITAVAYLAFALILFFKARKIGQFFVNQPEEEVSLAGPVSSDVLALAFRCLGVYALISWVPPLVQNLAKSIVTASQYPNQVPLLYAFSWITLVTSVIGSLIGLLLVLRTNVVIRLANFSRTDSPRSTETKEPTM